jgi:triacylglycerol lipase
MFTRKFIEAVLEYTKAEKIYVIGHSMGVTLAR